jgi:hypothetical protein
LQYVSGDAVAQQAPVSLEFLNSDLLRVNIHLPSKVSYAVTSLEGLDEIIKDRARGRRDRLTEASGRELIAPCQPVVMAERVAEIVYGLARRKNGLRCRRSYWKSVKSCYGRARMKYVIQGIASQILGSYVLTRLRMLLHEQR